MSAEAEEPEEKVAILTRLSVDDAARLLELARREDRSIAATVRRIILAELEAAEAKP